MIPLVIYVKTLVLFIGSIYIINWLVAAISCTIYTELNFYQSTGGVKMTADILLSLKVFGVGFAISMCIAMLIKLLLDAIKHFTRNSNEIQE